MAWRSEFRFYVELTTMDGERIGDFPLEVDWFPALQCAEFEQDLVNECAPETRSAEPLIEPEWSSLSDRPFISGFRVRRGEETDAGVS